MAITIKYAGSPALTGLAAYAGGQAKYRQEQQRAWMPIIAQRQQMAFEQQQTMQRQQFQLGFQDRAFQQENALVKGEQEWRAGEAEKGRTFQSGEGQAEREFRAGEADEQRGWLREGQGLDWQQQQQRDAVQFRRQRQLQNDDLNNRIAALREEGLMTGEFYYSDEQKRQMQELESAAVNIQNNAMLDADQKRQALGQLRQKHDAIRNAPQTARGDQRAMTPEAEVQQNYRQTPGGERMWKQPDGQWIQLRPEPSPEQAQQERSQAQREKLQDAIDDLQAKMDQNYETYAAQTNDQGNRQFSDEQINGFLSRKQRQIQNLQQRLAELDSQGSGGWRAEQLPAPAGQGGDQRQLQGPDGGAAQVTSPDGKYIWDGTQWRPR